MRMPVGAHPAFYMLCAALRGRAICSLPVQAALLNFLDETQQTQHGDDDEDCHNTQYDAGTGRKIRMVRFGHVQIVVSLIDPRKLNMYDVLCICTGYTATLFSTE